MEMMKMIGMGKQKKPSQFVLHVYDLPEDMIMEILLRLPTRSVGRLRCVSKSWLSITTSHTFLQSHSQSSTTHKSLIIQQQNRSNFYFASANSNNAAITFCNPTTKQRPKETIVEASWQGFLLLRNSITQHHSLFNPLTSQSINLPNSKCKSNLFLCLYLHRSTSKYRLNRLYSVDKTEFLVVGEPYWRRITRLLPAFHHHPHPVEFNGRMHWLSTTQRNIYKPPFIDYKVLPNTIMTFDTETEKYNLLPLPPIKNTRNLGGNLINFNGELGLWNMDCHFLDLWIMENNSSWVKRYSVDCQKVPEVRQRLSNIILSDPWLLGVAVPVGDEELLIDVSASMGDCCVLRVNLKHGMCCLLWWRGCGRLNMSFPYVESLTNIIKCNSSFSCSQILPPRRHHWVFYSVICILLSSFLYFMFSTN